MKKKCGDAWETLMKHELGVSITAIKICENSIKEGFDALP